MVDRGQRKYVIVTHESHSTSGALGSSVSNVLFPIFSIWWTDKLHAQYICSEDDSQIRPDTFWDSPLRWPADYYPVST